MSITLKRIIPLAVAVLFLSGCSAGGDSEAARTPSPVETTSKNGAACEAFEEVTLEVGNEVTKSQIDKTYDIPAAFDEVALSAEGEVKERILAVIDNLPATPFMIVWMDNRDAYTDDLKAVQRACAAEGFDIEVAALVAAGG